MNLIINNTEKLKGEIYIPGSKSHTIRAVVIASCANGTSYVRNPLESFDTKAAFKACMQLGAEISVNDKLWTIKGFGLNMKKPEGILNMMNSGTSLNLVTGISSHGNFEVTFDGDDSLRKRPMKPLLDSLTDLGVKVHSENNQGLPPFTIYGPYKGGKTKISGVNSQYISSLLISAPLCKKDTEIEVENLHEIPYVKITLSWLDYENIKYETNEDLTWFKVYGDQGYSSFDRMIPADWSSAAFPICAALICGEEVLIKGPDINDVQGDKGIIDVLKSMGADITIDNQGITVRKSKLKGKTIDLNTMPDALPALSVMACFAEGETSIINVGQARIKETDRIKVMTEELGKMGADVKELPEGMVIKQSKLKGAELNGYDDHRIIMALSLAGMTSNGSTSISTAESVGVTFPDYIESMKKLGAEFTLK